MSWSITANIHESCSCAAMCPCLLGPAKPDQGWCSGVFGIDIANGNSDGVDLSGVKMVLHFELPGDFLGGIDKARLYVDEGADEGQRREIDSIFHGEKGGLWGGLKEAIGQWLPTTVTKVEMHDGDSPGTTVAGVGQINLQPIKTEDGRPTKITDAPILAAFSIPFEDLAFAQGTKFSDPDMRAWESLGQGGTAQAVWSG
jgi:hypothetical protein